MKWVYATAHLCNMMQFKNGNNKENPVVHAKLERTMIFEMQTKLAIPIPFGRIGDLLLQRLSGIIVVLYFGFWKP